MRGHSGCLSLLVSILRHHLIALGIAVDILGCTGPVAERAATVHKIIQLGVELWRSAGDLFALSAVMKALQLPQVLMYDGKGKGECFPTEQISRHLLVLVLQYYMVLLA